MSDQVGIILQIAGALLLMVATFFLYRVSGTLDTLEQDVATGKMELVNEISLLRVELANDYVKNSEFLLVRQRVHDLSSIVGKIDQWQRFYDDDKNKSGFYK